MLRSQHQQRQRWIWELEVAHCEQRCCFRVLEIEAHHIGREAPGPCLSRLQLQAELDIKILGRNRSRRQMRANVASMDPQQTRSLHVLNFPVARCSVMSGG